MKKNKKEEEKENSILLVSWLAKTIIDHPELIKNKGPVGFYADLQAIWLKELQIAAKTLGEQLKGFIKQ